MQISVLSIVLSFHWYSNRGWVAPSGHSVALPDGRMMLCFYRRPGMCPDLWTSARLAYEIPPTCTMNVLVVWWSLHGWKSADVLMMWPLWSFTKVPSERTQVLSNVWRHALVTKCTKNEKFGLFLLHFYFYFFYILFHIFYFISVWFCVACMQTLLM